MKDLPVLPKETSLRSLTPLDYGVLELTLESVRAVIFDLDGTLVDDWPHLREAAREAIILDLKGLGFDVSELSAKQPIQSIMDAAYRQIDRPALKITRQTLSDRLNRQLDGFEMEAHLKSDVKPRALDVVREIKAKGYRVGLVTNSGAKTTQLTLDRHHLREFFDAVVTRNDIQRMKPSGEGLEKILDLLQVGASETIYVGDSWADIAAAREIGVRVIAVEGGISTRERLQEQSPELILPSLDKLPSLLPQIP